MDPPPSIFWMPRALFLRIVHVAKNRCPRAKMRTYAVLWHGSLVGIYSCAVDAAIAAKRLDRSTVVACQLNGETSTGAALLANLTR
jgi:hypothetical protein